MKHLVTMYSHSFQLRGYWVTWYVDLGEWGLGLSLCVCPGFTLRLGPCYLEVEKW